MMVFDVASQAPFGFFTGFVRGEAGRYFYERFDSRGDADYGNKLLSAMRYEFGGHLEKGVTTLKVA